VRANRLGDVAALRVIAIPPERDPRQPRLPLLPVNGALRIGGKPVELAARPCRSGAESSSRLRRAAQSAARAQHAAIDGFAQLAPSGAQRYGSRTAEWNSSRKLGGGAGDNQAAILDDLPRI